MPAFRADRHPQADFPRTFGNRYIHDVHNADAAHQQRDAGDAGQQHRHQVGGRTHHRTELFLRPYRKVFLVELTDAVVFAQYGPDFLYGFTARFLARGRGEDAAQVRDGQNTFLNRRVGRQNQVVLVLSHRVVAFLLQNADDFERRLVEPYRLAERVAVLAEQFGGHRLADNAYLGDMADVVFGKHLAVLHLIHANARVFGIDTIERRGRVVGTVNGLPARIDRGRTEVDMRQVFDAHVVFQLEAFHVGRVLSYAAHAHHAGMYHNHVRPHFRDLRLDAAFRPLADGQHGDDRGHADHNAEHGQETAQLIVVERTECDLYEIFPVHVNPPLWGAAPTLRRPNGCRSAVCLPPRVRL